MQGDGAAMSVKERALNVVEARWGELLSLVQRVPRRHMEEPGAVGIWSVKDLLGHITTWEEECIKAITRHLEGKRPVRYGSIDAFNARQAAAKKDLPLVDIVERLHEGHARLVSFLKGLPEECFDSRTTTRKRMRLDVYAHYQLHAEDLARWLGGS